MNCSYIVVEIFACLSDPKSCVVWERDSQGNGAKGQGWCDFWSPIKTIKIYHNRYQAQVEPALYLCLVSHKAHHLKVLMGPVVCGSGGVRGGSRGCLISAHHNCLVVTITENFLYHKVTKDTSSFPFHASKSAHLLTNLYFFSSITLESFFNCYFINFVFIFIHFNSKEQEETLWWWLQIISSLVETVWSFFYIITRPPNFFVLLLFGKEVEFHLYFHSNVHFMF